MNKLRIKIIFLGEDKRQLFTLENLYVDSPKEGMEIAKRFAKGLGFKAEDRVIVQNDPSDVSERLERIEHMLTKVLEENEQAKEA